MNIKTYIIYLLLIGFLMALGLNLPDCDNLEYIFGDNFCSNLEGDN